VVSSHDTIGRQLVPPPPATGVEFPVLDTLRAVGALCVLTTHVAFWAGDYTNHGVWGTLLARLDVGVAIFFVLSGFLLGRPWLARAADGRGPVPTVPYYRNRFLRIMPVYVVAVVLALTLVTANDDLGPRDWIRTLLMLDTLTGSGFPAGITQMWSLAVEVSFYLVLPVLMVLLVGRGGHLRPWRVLTGVVVLVGVTVWWHLDGATWAGERSSGAPLQWLPAYLTWFAGGLFLALVQVLWERGAWTALTARVVALGAQPGSCWAAALGLMLVAATPLAGPSMLAAPTPAQSLTKNLLYAAVGVLVVLTGVFTTPGSRYAGLMSRVSLRRLGWISYGVFCLHLLMLHFVMWSTGWELFSGGGVAMWLMTLGPSLLVAEASYRLIERPALRLKAHAATAAPRSPAASR